MKNSLFKNKLALRATSFFALLSITLALLPLSANAQTTEQPPPPSRQLTMKEKTNKQPARLALVIGNANYENIDKLKNSSADATDMTVALQALGFEVISGIDQNRKQMMTKIREFGDKLNSQKGVGLFFYAGHGVQSNGQNYLVPVDADIPREDEINDSAINIGQVLAKFDTAGADMNIIILDACRNNPFAKEWSEFRAASSGDGIGKIVAPTGTILFYATQPGKAASDGAGRNGLFTEALLENIKKPNLEFDVMAKVVSRRVAEKSKQLQIPYKEGPNYSDFYFAGAAVENPVLPSPVVKAN
ncbi:MAG: caspase family protein [Pyrinomonadaceae bacterium]|nr:caspase family protein [Pyrinomonadaceae bacterium]